MSVSSPNTYKGISAKIFIGIYLNSELNMHLRNSTTWQQHQAVPSSADQVLSKSVYQDREYLGFFIDESKPTLEYIQELEKKLRSELKAHCPDLAVDQTDIKIFSQVFLS